MYRQLNTLLALTTYVLLVVNKLFYRKFQRLVMYPKYLRLLTEVRMFPRLRAPKVVALRSIRVESRLFSAFSGIASCPDRTFTIFSHSTLTEVPGVQSRQNGCPKETEKGDGEHQLQVGSGDEVGKIRSRLQADPQVAQAGQSQIGHHRQQHPAA